MKIESQKSGHALQNYIMDRISEIDGSVLLDRNSKEVVMDEDGTYWLCDKGVKQGEDLEDQGCWRCRDSFVMR